MPNSVYYNCSTSSDAGVPSPKGLWTKLINNSEE
jgi:hypothetical protein